MGTSRSKRRSVRRAVAVECTLACDLWDGSVPLRASDLSNEGVWIDTPYPLEPGEEVVVALAPPGAGMHEDVWAIAEVARVGMWRRERDPYPPGMGLAFTYLNAVDRRFLARSLVGHPPRLPGRRKPPPLPAMREPLARAPVALTLRDVTFLDHAPRREAPFVEPPPWAFDELPPVLALTLAAAENDGELLHSRGSTRWTAGAHARLRG